MPLTKYDRECVTAARDFINKDTSVHYSIPEIAKKVGLSTTRLKTGFKEIYGMGLYHYLGELRLEKGKELLENTDKTLKEISKQLGYGYKSNFSTAFKKKFGKPPATWKKNLPFKTS